MIYGFTMKFGDFPERGENSSEPKLSAYKFSKF
jgi:hypothetical protein